MSEKLPLDLPEGYVDFYKTLESWQNVQQIKLKKDYTSPIDNVLTILALNNKSITQCVDFPLDVDKYKFMYQQLLELLRTSRPTTRLIIDKILDNLEQIDFNLLPAKYFAGDQQYFSELSNRLEAPEELLLFSVDHAIRPWLRLWAEPHYDAVANDEFQSWQLPVICPFCGSRSHFSRLRAADGRRFMFCEHCFTEWETRSLYCVHCGNDNPQSIQYLSVEDDLAYQLYTCDKCKGYIKSFDERQKGNKTDLFIANIETIYLDILAQEQGYSSHDEDWPGNHRDA